jgi:methionine-rich copper-binding protein CopC
VNAGLSRRRVSLGACWLGALTIGVVASHHAEAHAQLLRAEPPVGSLLRDPPDQLSLVFSEGIEPAFSAIHVTDAAGNRVDRDDLRRDPQQPVRLYVGLNRLPPGVYRVEWRVTSVDTHKTQGSFTFTVTAP